MRQGPAGAVAYSLRRGVAGRRAVELVPLIPVVAASRVSSGRALRLSGHE